MIEVVGAGWGRTGTFSLKSALERLGLGPCYHMFELFTHHPEHAASWRAAARGQDVDWTQLLAGYRSAVDWPACAFWPELVGEFGDAKVVLTVRPADDWYGSYRATISAGVPDDDPGDDDLAGSMVHHVVVRRSFGGSTDHADVLAAYAANVERVRSAVPADRLLEWSVRDGWRPLCRFLDVEVPDEPFPHVNTRDEFAQRARRRRGG